MSFDICDLAMTLQAIAARILFLVHSIFAVWAATCVTKRNQLWALIVLSGLSIAEMIYSLVKRKGKEWKWISPCVLMYLMTVIPPIWLLNLDMFMCMQTSTGGTSTGGGTCIGIHGGNSTTCSFFRAENAFDRKPLVYTIEEIMLLLLIVGRWLLPKGNITRDQLSQLLFVYFGVAFDIMELFYLFEEQTVLLHPQMQYVILSLWSFSLFQFVIVSTTVKTRRDRLSRETRGAYGLVHRLTMCSCCHSEIWGLMTTVIMQDGPFLILRLYCLGGLKIFSYNLLFYTLKNILILMLQFYRITILAIHQVRPDFDTIPPPRTPSVEILGPAQPRSNNNSMTAAAAGRSWASQRSFDSIYGQKAADRTADRTDSSDGRLIRSGSQDFNFVSNV